MLKWCRNLFREKFVVITYRRKVDKYYGLQGCYYEDAKIAHPCGSDLAMVPAMMTAMYAEERLLCSGYVIIKKEIKYI